MNKDGLILIGVLLASAYFAIGGIYMAVDIILYWMGV
jgi:hypothetical protein